MQEVTIVGGGLAGLIAAISVAEQGGRVSLHERRPVLGGRATTKEGPYRTNFGPHALYTGPMTAWLEARDLLPARVAPAEGSFAMVWRGERQPFPPIFAAVMESLSLEAPVERDYRGWARDEIGEEAAEAAASYLSLPTFHADPGALSAAFAQWRLQRAFKADAVTYILGGWSALVEKLEARARELGVAIATGSRVTALPNGPTIVATDLPAAAGLLNKASITWPRARTALFDLAVSAEADDPVSLLDLDERVYLVRASRYDETLAPAGQQLVQGCAGIREGEGLQGAIARIEGVLDRAYQGWRKRCHWSHTAVYVGATPLDPPGTTWRDRPAVRQGEALWLIGDSVAAPGLLSEVSLASAVTAAEQAVEVARKGPRAFSEGASGALEEA